MDEPDGGEQLDAPETGEVLPDCIVHCGVVVRVGLPSRDDSSKNIWLQREAVLLSRRLSLQMPRPTPRCPRANPREAKSWTEPETSKRSETSDTCGRAISGIQWPLSLPGSQPWSSRRGSPRTARARSCRRLRGRSRCRCGRPWGGCPSWAPGGRRKPSAITSTSRWGTDTTLSSPTPRWSLSTG
ncbi:unnamed protein product, partial [Effrenium voratum]